MFNPEKILGGLLTSAMQGAGGGLGMKAGLGMGILGVAMGAAEHFMEKQRTGAPGLPGAPPPPPPGPPRIPTAGPAMAPPMPAGTPYPPAGGPPVPPGLKPEGIPTTPAQFAAAAPPPVASADATLLIRAMIAAAHADGAMDADEKARIMDRLSGLDLSAEDRAFLETEMNAPIGLEALAAGAGDPELARQVYAVSIMAITIDTEAEKRYLKDLAWHLGISPSQASRIHEELGIPRP